jgi:hypothetical protein
VTVGRILYALGHHGGVQSAVVCFRVLGCSFGCHRIARACSCVADMAKTLSVMRALEVPQHVAELLIQAHGGNVAAAVSAAVEGHHG